MLLCLNGHVCCSGTPHHVVAKNNEYKELFGDRASNIYQDTNINMIIFIQTTVTIIKNNMLDDFFIRALIAGIGIALITGPIGCFVIWRRLSFFAGTLAHSALLGVTMAYI